MKTDIHPYPAYKPSGDPGSATCQTTGTGVGIIRRSSGTLA